jgi:hypothetical protein
MAAISDYLENKLLDHVLKDGSATFTEPTVVKLALFTQSPTDTGSTTNEVSGGSYARQTITFASSAASGTISNTADIEFTTMPGATVTHVGVFADATDNMLFHGALSSSKAVDAGDTFKISTGDLDISLD